MIQDSVETFLIRFRLQFCGCTCGCTVNLWKRKRIVGDTSTRRFLKIKNYIKSVKVINCFEDIL